MAVRAIRFPHSEISGSKVARHLPEAYRRHAASFIASWSQGIHRAPLTRYSIRESRNHFPILFAAPRALDDAPAAQIELSMKLSVLPSFSRKKTAFGGFKHHKIMVVYRLFVGLFFLSSIPCIPLYARRKKSQGQHATQPAPAHKKPRESTKAPPPGSCRAVGLFFFFLQTTHYQPWTMSGASCPCASAQGTARRLPVRQDRRQAPRQWQAPPRRP